MTARLILVVEDHAPSRQLLCDLLRHHGHTVLEAVDVATARQILATQIPDLVLTDVSFRGGGGTSVLTAIREAPNLRHIPVAAVTANAMQGDRERLLACGFDAYFAKPIDIRTFAAHVDALCAACSS